MCIHEPALLVQTHLSPAVRTASGLPGVFRPGLVAKFTGMRDGVKNPGHFSGSHVVSTDVTGRGSILFPGRGAQNNQIAVARRAQLNLNDGVEDRSRRPPSPPTRRRRVRINSPVRASTASRRLLKAIKSLCSDPSLLCQKLMPRCISISGTSLEWYTQSCRPLAASSATIEVFCARTYIVLPTISRLNS